MLCSGGGNLMVLTMIVTGMSEARRPNPNPGLLSPNPTPES